MKKYFIFTAIALLLIPILSRAALIPTSVYRDTVGNFIRPLISTDGFRLPSLTSKDCIGTDADGDFQAGTCSGGSGTFSWTPTGYGVSTSTTLGFLNGFLSTASSTFTGGFLADRSTTTQATTTNSFATTASSTNLATTNFHFGGVNGNSWDDYCVSITGGAGLCDGDDASGAGGGFAWTVTGYGVSTSTRLGFLNGFLSTASSTVDSNLTITGNATTTNLFLPSLGQIGFNNGALTLTHGSNFLTLAGGGLRTTDVGIGIDKANSASIALDVAVSGSPFTQGVRVEGDATTRLGFSGFVTGDSQVRYTQRVDGLMGWGSGSAVTDTNLYRNLANELKTDDNFVIAGNSTTTNATTTAFAVSSLTSALVTSNSTGGLEEYAGTSCTNQFVRSLSVLGAATCATVGTADVSGLDISDDTNLAATWPVTLTGDTLSWSGLATTSNPTAGNLFYSNGTTGLVPVATSSLSVSTGISTSATLGALVGGSNASLSIDQSFSPTWTGEHIFNTITRSTTTQATTTNLFSTTASSTNLASTNFHFGGINGNSWDDFCVSITGGAGLCDGDDATGAGGAFAWTPDTYSGTVVNSTTTPIWFKATTPYSTIASSTLTSATTTTGALQAGSTAIGNSVVKVSPLTGLTTSNSESVGGIFNLNSGTTDALGMVLYNNNTGSQRLLSLVCDQAAYSGNCLHVRSDGTATALNVSGAPTGQGLIKAGANGVGDADAAILSLDASTSGFLGQSMFMKCGTNSTCWNLRDSNNNQTLTVNSVGRYGWGTTTPAWQVQIASTTGAQLALTDPSSTTNNHWVFRNAGGLFYLATSSPAFATSTRAALTIDSNNTATFGNDLTATNNSRARAFIPTGHTVPTNGLYLTVEGSNGISWAVNSTAEMNLSSTALTPGANDGNALGTGTLKWADLFLADGGVINWNNGNTTLTHSSDLLTLSASDGFTMTGAFINSDGSLEIPNGTNPTTDATGELAWDTSPGGNLKLATSTTGHVVLGSATTTLYAFTVASTSADFISGGVIELPAHYLSQVAVAVICKADAGTSVVINLSNIGGTSDTNTATCTTTSTQFQFTTNNTFAAYAAPRLELGTITGTVDRVAIRILGYRTSD